MAVEVQEREVEVLADYAGVFGYEGKAVLRRGLLEDALALVEGEEALAKKAGIIALAPYGLVFTRT